MHSIGMSREICIDEAVLVYFGAEDCRDKAVGSVVVTGMLVEGVVVGVGVLSPRGRGSGPPTSA